MTNIPVNEVTQQDLEEWYELSRQLADIKVKESLLRQKIFKGLFQNPNEGTNSLPLDYGYVLKGKHTINRSVDEAALVALRDELGKAGIPVNDLIRMKPDLVLKEYRLLTEEQAKVFDQVLTIKPGMPALEIVLPKKNAK